MASPYVTFNREQWRALRASTPLTISDEELSCLQGLNENISMTEVADIYLPLSRLLNLYVGGMQELYQATHTFLGNQDGKVPFIIGIAGSVAVGKSTTARILQTLLSRWPNHPKVDLVTTDGFLYPNRVLEERGIMKRKGFPESYDLRRFINFLADVKSGLPEVKAPVYSHLVYDIVPGEWQTVRQPDILIVEGLNVLQPPKGDEPRISEVIVSDFFDYSIYVHAEEKDILEWYVERFKLLRQTAFSDPNSYFRRYASLSDEEATEVATGIWTEINGANLVQNILPTRVRAQLILNKGQDHMVQSVKLRKL
ncbi:MULTISPECIES: type I pantothenate kinase [Brevibacillus]|jgi:pantothenate kinase, bacterial type|uniref:Pantothenate kinase n=1 Tax=Brevibacillus parabrevis TaxID=54914 RepID=A0A4Y3PJ99_BREPA|nr:MULTISPECIES: type I pantothenate kinase [Brevibacillus]MDH6348182.1 type I pantothenate kinase [Brevibacillus sp. 1238]MDR5000307.1 type I pantothenate kinase [Brevibacillus parabrevis]MED2256707.1 type I pantothenate kinase [Brevibacillus parabrevis]UED70268.1 type I pantothenate kinase [Brevibacillus sp. HD3.3A]WDV96566.1 type I pantothenate kinase [Brevibacillus parabrevis]